MTRKTEKAVVRAAMRWLKQYENYQFPRQWEREHETKIARACRAHAKAVKEKRK